jgi:lipopolysaccharide transport system ATP-binding protein
MSDIAIRVENLSKLYRIGAKQEPYRTLRDTLAGAASAPFRRIRSAFQNKCDQTPTTANDFWALKDVSFEVKRGVRATTPRCAILPADGADVR